ncbi:hypothetical protein CEXT_654641 [Caerostris extrusa]|uniref:Uncharacterized protein n=1 Tax=Caerostris extrusa TaxID=172846 RepID=A0AAV4PGY5_CAEEX|nr:hypothetical protein CEXT_654641 [Caerostris extrusa]
MSFAYRYREKKVHIVLVKARMGDGFSSGFIAAATRSWVWWPQRTLHSIVHTARPPTPLYFEQIETLTTWSSPCSGSIAIHTQLIAQGSLRLSESYFLHVVIVSIENGLHRSTRVWHLSAIPRDYWRDFPTYGY